MISHDPETDELLARAGASEGARAALLERHRDRLRRMVALRLDHRLAARLDASDVVQETLAEAVVRLPDYLRDRPLPFYPWLRQLAWERLVDLHRRHVRAQKRTVRREERQTPVLPDTSAMELADLLLARESNPSAEIRRLELRVQVQNALAVLTETDRELLILRHLEQLSTPEITAILGITEGAFYTRHVRALDRFRNLIREALKGEEP